eukprot:1176444-Prorocentrum_minimum.AAC.2
MTECVGEIDEACEGWRANLHGGGQILQRFELLAERVVRVSVGGVRGEDEVPAKVRSAKLAHEHAYVNHTLDGARSSNQVRNFGRTHLSDAVNVEDHDIRCCSRLSVKQCGHLLILRLEALTVRTPANTLPRQVSKGADDRGTFSTN